ncbi:uncharacterized protein LOC143053992 isoform X1 [Mytilus galloprovincialis]|uniref:uncharacterized protein LOC143053992 isoform X1 n=1 Tax=Mytilus galloprovincialis TaxID=29158 RepID=UPI003F7C3CB9
MLHPRCFKELLQRQTFSFLLEQQFVDCVEKNYLELTVLNMLRRSTLLKTNTKIAEAEILPPKRKRALDKVPGKPYRGKVVYTILDLDVTNNKDTITNITTLDLRVVI